MEGRVSFDSQFEATVHSRKARHGSTIRRQRAMDADAKLAICFVQSQTPANGRVQPTFRVGLLTLINSI